MRNEEWQPGTVSEAWPGYAMLRRNLIGQGFPNDVDAYPDR